MVASWTHRLLHPRRGKTCLEPVIRRWTEVGSVQIRLESAESWLRTLGEPRSTLQFCGFFSGTVPLDWGITNRVLDEHLMYLVTAGSCIGTIEQQRSVLNPGCFMWIQPGVRHTFALAVPTQPITVYTARFRLRAGTVDCGVRDLPTWRHEEAWPVVDLMDQLVDELRARLPYREPRLRALLLAISALALRPGQRNTPAEGTLALDQRKALEAFVDEHVADRPSPRELAAQLHLSHDYFSRLFTRTYGLPPRRFIVRERTRRGAQLLAETPLTISQIAQSLGYDSAGHFARQFKQAYGISPRSYRRHP